MSALITAMLVATGLCIATAVQGWNPWFAGLFLIEAAVVTGFAVAIMANLASLASCISRSTPPTPPTPPGPPGGTGTGTGTGTSGAPPI